MTMADKKPLFKAPYDIKDVSALFAIVALILIISALIGNNLFSYFSKQADKNNFKYSKHCLEIFGLCENCKLKN